MNWKRGADLHIRSTQVATDFQSLCLDTLVYDALIGTDPDRDVFRTMAEISNDILSHHPSVLSKAPQSLPDRLDWLSSKENALRIRKHGVDNYALPFQVRNQFDDGNLNIKTQENEFVGSILGRVKDELPDLDERLRSLVSKAIQHTVHDTFRQQALNFVASFQRSDGAPHIEVFSIINSFFEGEELDSEELEVCVLGTANVFRHVCYSSTPEEREYVELLIKYFSVRFVMDGDVAVTRYFSEMAKRLRIYLGTDIIVRCLSEVFVRPSSRGMTNALQKLQNSGVTLHLTRQVAEEVLSQFGNAYWFNDKSKYIDDFIAYLNDKFDFQFIETKELLAKIDHKLAERVARNIMNDREQVSSVGNQILAHNDAQMALLINAERAENDERVSSDLYGYNTWWMTEEKFVLNALRQAGEHADVVMQPQFLINHYLLDPRTRAQSENSNTPLTPKLFGLRITNRVESSVMRRFLSKVGEYADLDKAASRAKIRSAANILKRS